MCYSESQLTLLTDCLAISTFPPVDRKPIHDRVREVIERSSKDALNCLEHSKGAPESEGIVELLENIGLEIKNKIDSLSESFSIASDFFENSSYGTNWCDGFDLTETFPEAANLVVARAGQAMHEESQSLRFASSEVMGQSVTTSCSDEDNQNSLSHLPHRGTSDPLPSDSTLSVPGSSRSDDENAIRSSNSCPMTAMTSLPSEARDSLNDAVGLRCVTM